MDDQVRTPDEELELLSAGELDDTDVELLGELARLMETVDPVPAGLTDRLEFALALDEVYAEVAQITRMAVDAALVRGEATQTRATTLTFSADSLTAMVTMSADDAGTVRIDGWLTPAAPLQVRLRTGDGVSAVDADATGRFAFGGVAHGLAQLSFHPEGAEAATVVTPAFEV